MKVNPASSNIVFKSKKDFPKDKLPPPGGILIVIVPKCPPKDCGTKLDCKA